MYYRNRSTFYIRHFGSKLLIIAIIAVIFLFGTYSYINAANVTPKAMLNAMQAEFEDAKEVASLDEKKDTVKEEIKKEETVKQEAVVESKKETTDVKKEDKKQNTSLSVKKDNKLKYTKYKNVPLKDLKTYKLSGGVKVVEVLDSNKLVVEDIDSTKYTVNLIGVSGLDETKYSREGVINTVNSLNAMLKSKLVQLEFDIEKQNQDGTLNAYVYYNKALLNADIIATGYADIKVESSNTNKIGDLLIALKDAKADKLGIWKNTNN